jgi:hypothetical protein
MTAPETATANEEINMPARFSKKIPLLSRNYNNIGASKQVIAM